MSYETLRLERSGAVANIFLHRPEKLNALNLTLQTEIIEVVDVLSTDEGVKVLVFAGSDGRAFAAGADIAEFAARSVEQQQAFMSGRRMYDVVYDCPKPTIAAVHGYCLGGGCELALSCDIRIADRTARFGQPEIRLGLIPGGGGTQRLARLVGQGQALRMTLTGDQIDAEEAFRIGLVELLVDEGTLLDRARELAERIERWSLGSLRRAKQAIRCAWEQPLSEGLETERGLFLAAFESEEGRRGVRAFVERDRGEASG